MIEIPGFAAARSIRNSYICTQLHQTQPQATSPAVNTALNQGVNNFDVLDYAGKPRVNGTGQTDIGAYEE